MENTKLYETLTNDNDFLEKLGAASTPAEVQRILMERGISISAVEAEEALSRSNAEGELSESDMEMVAGGKSSCLFCGRNDYKGSLVWHIVRHLLGFEKSPGA